ncbi:ammonium transporter [Phragmitibacter flavus]|uniref:Ammonium transporter n=1 Tax=Phragmitibacter flavus TaxID=2576071 RepID=A0A5R8KLF0_9BACT|nr:ammonium transporter [Phragmitibacter flavus]TLD72529.1 ammonium transporter [Phragmitibacter flavus]
MEEDAVKFLGTFVSESFYYWASVIMLMIHVGFLAYEGGVARTKNVLATMTKNLLTLCSVGISFFLFGWWVYNAFPLFPFGPLLGPWTDAESLSDSGKAAMGLVEASYPWSPAVGPNPGDHLTGVFVFAFALFAMTTGSIMSGALIERAKMGGYLILSVILGSVCWVIGGAWGWNPYGWFFTKLGYHDFGCSAVVHGIAGFFTLGVLMVLGPRIGKYVNGKPVAILPHNLPLTLVGLMCIFVGFFGFLAACAIMLPGQAGIITIYGTPMTLSSMGLNTLLALAAGIIGAYISSKGDPFFTISGGLAGIITIGAGIDLYQPALIIVLAFAGAFLMPKIAMFIEKKGVDDVVGAVAVHGFCGFIGAVLPGIFAAGYVQGEGIPPISFVGQLTCALVCCVILGFLPGLGSAYVLQKFGLLRVSKEEEIEGLDLADCGYGAYPEAGVSGITMKPAPDPEIVATAPATKLATESA